MISAAAVLVLLGLALFVGGFLTDITLLYWACVAACGVAGVLLVLARMRMGGAPAAPGPRGAAPTTGPGTRAPATAQLPAAGGSTPSGGTATSAGSTTSAGSATSAGTATSGGTATAGRSAPAGSAPASTPSAGAHAGTPDAAVEPAGAGSPEATAQPAVAAHGPRGVPGPENLAGDPPVEEVEVTDLLLVVDLRDEVLVVDEHPRYHLAGCRWLAGRETIPLPVDEARTDGFTPCRWCEPDRTLAERERGRRARRKG